VARPLARRGALRRWIADHRPDHPDGFGCLATHRRSEHQRHHVRPQALRPRDGAGGGGSFIGISSIASSNTHRWFGAYGVTKAGLDHLMMLAADELGPSWVRVNSIRPGLIRTDMVAPITDSPELSEDYRICTPLPRAGEAEDIANMAMFLLSDAAGWVTGQVINVDGGHLLRRGPDFTAMLEPVFGADGLRGVV
jgi:NAD(P)-dependent dehydrogenase (short-subunit alcohol dehydrogenase family)